jgi:C4-dicarboxylate transporter
MSSDIFKIFINMPRKCATGFARALYVIFRRSQVCHGLCPCSLRDFPEIASVPRALPVRFWIFFRTPPFCLIN